MTPNIIEPKSNKVQNTWSYFYCAIESKLGYLYEDSEKMLSDGHLLTETYHEKQ
jgi:hypothetical protein